MILELKEARTAVEALYLERQLLAERGSYDVGELADIDQKLDMAQAYLEDLESQYAVEMRQIGSMWSAREQELTRKRIFT